MRGFFFSKLDIKSDEPLAIARGSDHLPNPRDETHTAVIVRRCLT